MNLSFDAMQHDPRTRNYVMPARVAWQTGGASAPRNPESLLTYDTTPCQLRFDNDSPPGVLLDFGRELNGGVEIWNGLTGDQRPVPVRVRFGESLTEAMSEPNQDHAIHDSVVQIPWYGPTEIGNTGFRFVRIDLVEPGTELKLRNVRAVLVYRDIPYVGAFECDDERLNAIWRTAAYTCHLCMQNYLWDGVKRDRLVWIGDMHPEAMTISAVFGGNECVPRSLNYVRDETPLPEWMNGISSYSLWWVLIHHTWYLHHGDLGYLREQHDYLIALLRQLRDNVGEGYAEQLGGHRFLDWPSSGDETAIHAGLQALMVMAFRAGAELCHALGEGDEQDACMSLAACMQQHTPQPTQSKQANALLSLAGLDDAQAVNSHVLAQDPFHNLSTFYGYYVLQARAMASDFQGGLDVIRSYWGGMLDRGATTFWEDFNLKWTENAGRIDDFTPNGKDDLHADFGDYCYKGLRHSLCHGWASGPAPWLSEHVLGVRPIEPGCRTVMVDPHLGDLQFARGAYPTPFGPVSVSHEQTAAGVVRSAIEAPEGVHVVRPGA